MTEYGRGSGSQPWHPGDSPSSPDFGQEGLYGGQAWDGQQAGAGHEPYAHDPLAQQPYPQSAAGYQTGRHPLQDPYGSQGHPDPYQQEYPHQHQQQDHQQWTGEQAGYAQQPQAPYGDGMPHGQAAQAHYGDGGAGWDPGYGGLDPADPYGRPTDPYTGGQPDFYATPDAYPPPEPPYARHHSQGGPADGYADPAHQAAMAATGPEAHPAPAAAAEPGTAHAVAAEPEAPEAERPSGALRPLALDEDPDGYDEPEEPGRGGRERRNNKPKRRSGLACLIVAVVLVGLIGGGGYFGYQFWQDHFGTPADYAGEGFGEVQVEIPPAAPGSEIGNILQREGVVKSSAAFVDAVNASGKSIQPGSYTLHREMSAAAAVEMMTGGASMNALIIHEGMRNAQVYAAIDEKIGLKAGTTAGVAKREAKNLGLPDWADDNPQINDPLEGFLYPSRYSVGKNAKPADVLREMVKTANAKYAKYDLDAKAKELGLDSPLQLVTVASLVQAEGVTHDEYRKMAEVVYNRLKPDNSQTFGKLQFDSTYNYIKNQSKTDIGLDEIKNYDHPYNTYFYKGLPPGPIGNPGAEALEAVQNPTHDGWYYFISLDSKTTKFTKTYAEFQELYDQYRNQKKG